MRPGISQPRHKSITLLRKYFQNILQFIESLTAVDPAHRSPSKRKGDPFDPTLPTPEIPPPLTNPLTSNKTRSTERGNHEGPSWHQSNRGVPHLSPATNNNGEPSPVSTPTTAAIEHWVWHPHTLNRRGFQVTNRSAAIQPVHPSPN